MPLRFRILAAASGDPAGATKTVITSDDPWSGNAAGPREETRFEVPSTPAELFVGRRSDADLSLPFASVSARHARLFRGDTEREWWLEDLGGVNGTWLDDVRVPQGRPASLRAGQRLRIGTIDLLFDGWSATPREDDGTGTLARRLISDLFSSPDSEVPTLVVQAGPVRVAPLRLTQRDRRYVAGRAETCELVLPSEHVSREHAAFIRRRDGVFVQDLGSRNSVRVNGAPVTREARLAEGDRIEVGAVVLSLTDPEQRYHERLQRIGGQAIDPAGPRQPVRAGTPTVGLTVAGGPGSPQTSSRVPVAEESPAPSVARLSAGGARASAARRTVASSAAPRPRRTVALSIVGAIVVLAVVALIVLLATWG